MAGWSSGMVGKRVGMWAALWPCTTLCVCMGLEGAKAESTGLFLALLFNTPVVPSIGAQWVWMEKRGYALAGNLAQFAKREGIKGIFAFFYSYLSPLTLSLKLCVEFVMVSVSGKIALLTPALFSIMVCVPVIDAGRRRGGVWQGEVLFWDPVGLGFLHAG